MYPIRNDLPYVRFADTFFFAGQKDRSVAAYDCRLFLLQSGDGHLHIGSDRHALHRFDLFYIPPGTPYRFEVEKRLVILAINFDFTHRKAAISDTLTPVDLEKFEAESITDAPPSVFSSPIVLHQAETIGTVLEDIVQEKTFLSEDGEYMASILLESALMRIYRARQHPISSKEQLLVGKLIAYMEEHASEPLSDVSIASALSYHPYYLNRILKKCTGQTMHAYLTRERIRRAATMLLTESASNEEIAARVGIPNAAHFAKLFRKQTGVSPSAYRKDPPLL